MSVDNRIPSEPYMELNGVTVYTENDKNLLVESNFMICQRLVEEL